MATGFGFSVGDLFLGLKIIKDSIEAVNDSTGASVDYAALIKEINNLQHGLNAVEELRLAHDLSQQQSLALKDAVSSCQETIQGFVNSIAKYQPHLHANASGLQSKFRKIKWSLCKKDDVAKLRAQLNSHTSLINMLLITIQSKQSLQINRVGNDEVIRAREDGTGELVGMLNGLSLEQRQFFMIIMQQNQQLMQNIGDMRCLLQNQKSLPPQIMLQQPVILLDPFGKIAPFHLEFVDSSECFFAVLKARFSNAGVKPAGLSKLENRDFLLQDTRRKKAIDVDKNWTSVFRPGQQVDMSMVFHRFVCPPSTCPGCLEENDEGYEQVYCQSCGLCYQNVQASSNRSDEWKRFFTSSRSGIDISGEEIPYLLRTPGKDPELQVFRPTKETEDELFEGYRRVRVVSQSLDLLDGKYPALQLIEDFCRFAELVKGAEDNLSPFLPEIRDLHARSVQHILQQRSSFPAFASFAQIERVRKELAKDSVKLRRKIDLLVQSLCNDTQTKDLMRYIKDTYPSSHGKDYYTGVLTRMVSLLEFTKRSEFKNSSIPRAKAAEQMQWSLLDSRPK
ncbi:hypothetical protein MMC21_000389 [Puttea exsequens]|nr:hypothetical protein [Puttea exsequens]